MGQEKIRIGTRASPLALWQAEWVKSCLEAEHAGIAVEIVKIKTTGDKILDSPLAKIGGKGLFVKEIEEALKANEIDIAVHSMKDVPVQLPPGLSISVVMKREDPRDALVSRNGVKLANLPKGARVGTGSLRRMSQLRHHRPDIEIVPLRGNVQTRLGKMESENLDAVILATAGLKRLKLEHLITESISPEILLPAMGQGAVGIEARTFSVDVVELILPLNDEDTHTALEAERAFLEVLGGGCQVPIGAHAVIEGDGLTLHGLVSALDGGKMIRLKKSGPAKNARSLGIKLGQEMLAGGADQILRDILDK